jgi:hypothetical protein
MTAQRQHTRLAKLSQICGTQLLSGCPEDPGEGLRIITRAGHSLGSRVTAVNNLEYRRMC